MAWLSRLTELVGVIIGTPPYTSNHLQQQDVTRGEPTNWEYHVRDFNASYHEKERPIRVFAAEYLRTGGVLSHEFEGLSPIKREPGIKSK